MSSGRGNPYHDKLGRFTFADGTTASPDDEPAPGHVFGYHATTSENANSILQSGFQQSMSPRPGMKNSVYFYPKPYNHGMKAGHEMAFGDAPITVIRAEFPISQAIKEGNPTNPKDTGAFYVVEADDIKDTDVIINPKEYADILDNQGQDRDAAMRNFTSKLMDTQKQKTWQQRSKELQEHYAAMAKREAEDLAADKRRGITYPPGSGYRGGAPVPAESDYPHRRRKKKR